MLTDVVASLHFDRVAAGAAPRSWALWTHGIFGTGGNLRSLARGFVERRPEWGVALVDLRLHGRSPAGEPPHTIAALAEDVIALAGSLGATALLGHSLGGKVMLQALALAPVSMAQTWVLDATPGARPGAWRDRANPVSKLLPLMERLPARFAQREEFVAAILRDGHAESLARWLAMNLVPADDGGYRLRLDLGAMRALLDDYCARDLWRETFDPARGDVELVLATRNSSVDTADRARLATAPPHVQVHPLAAGHWLHVDAPDALLSLLVERFARL